MKACVLAGGSSRRFGMDKVNAKIGTTRFVDHIAGLCVPRNLEPVLLGRPDDEQWPGIADATPGAGPLAALATGLEAFSQEILLIAVDMPLLSGADLDWLLRQSAPAEEIDYPATVPIVNGKKQWTFARYQQSCLPAIYDLLAGGVKALHQLEQHVAIHFPAVPAMTAERLMNVNTPADLAYAESWFHQRGCACPEDEEGA